MATGEFALIAALRGAARARNEAVELGIGDDAAVLAGGICLSCDLLVEGVHFRRATTSLDDLGWKALAVNASDLAAMGATPLAALVALGLPADADEHDALALYEGLDGCAAACGLEIAGGDVSRSPVMVLSVTAVGRTSQPARRDGGQTGDLLCVTGALGAARAGLELLEGRAQAPADVAGPLVERHRRPQPRLAEGRALAPLAHALMDVSDGLASDATRLAEASGLACAIDLDAVPVARGVEVIARTLGRTPGWLAAAGGEDYELLAALPREAIERCEVALTVVGELERGTPGAIRYRGAGSDDPPRGWDHLAPPG